MLLCLPLETGWKGMERCHFSASNESVGHLIERKVFSNPFHINADFSSFSHGDKHPSWDWDRLDCRFPAGAAARKALPEKVQITGTNIRTLGQEQP